MFDWASTAAATGVAAITAATTITVAVITARTTDGRLSRQITDAQERQERELAAEAARQAAALAHDRELADVADLRSVLDEATLVIDQAMRATVTASSEMHHHPGLTMQERAERGSRAEASLDQMREAIGPALARVRVRVGPGDELADALEAVDSALLDMASFALLYKFVQEDEDDKLTALRAQFEEAYAGFDRAAALFLNAAVDRAGTVQLRGDASVGTTLTGTNPGTS